MTDTVPQATTAPSNAWITPPLVRFATENFAVLSSLLLILGIVCSTVFLYAYLSVFDWHLIWIIEYPDILKFGLIAIGFIGGFAAIIQFIIDKTIQVRETTGKARWKVLALPIGIFAFLVVLDILVQWNKPDPAYARLAYYCLSGATLIVWTFLINHYVKNKEGVGFSEISSLSFLLLATCLTFGYTVGYSVRYSRDFEHDVHLKDQTIQDVILVMATSHHTILYMGKTALVVPTTDIVRFVSNPGRKR